MTFNVDTAMSRLVTADSDTSGDEVPGVGIGLETNQVRTQHSVEDFLPSLKANK